MSFQNLPVVQKFYSLNSAVDVFAMRASLNAFTQENEDAPKAGYFQLLSQLDADDIVGSLKRVSACAFEFDDSYTQNNFTVDFSIKVLEAYRSQCEDFPVYAALIVEMVDHPKCTGLLEDLDDAGMERIQEYRAAVTPEAIAIVNEINEVLRS